MNQEQPPKFANVLKSLRVKIRKIREAKSWTQDYMAYQLEISQKAYSKIESGETQLSVERLLQIAYVLKIDIMELLSDYSSAVHPNFFERCTNQLKKTVISLRKILVW